MGKSGLSPPVVAALKPHSFFWKIRTFDKMIPKVPQVSDCTLLMPLMFENVDDKVLSQEAPEK